MVFFKNKLSDYTSLLTVKRKHAHSFHVLNRLSRENKKTWEWAVWQPCFKRICLHICERRWQASILRAFWWPKSPKFCLMAIPCHLQSFTSFLGVPGGDERGEIWIKRLHFFFSLFLPTEGVPLVATAKASLAFHLILWYFTPVLCLSILLIALASKRAKVYLLRDSFLPES